MKISESWFYMVLPIQILNPLFSLFFKILKISFSLKKRFLFNGLIVHLQIFIYNYSFHFPFNYQTIVKFNV